MIKVNLLPEAPKARTQKGPRKKREIPITWIIGGLVVIAITCVGLALFHLNMQRKADTIQADIQKINADIKRLKVDVAKVNKFKTERSELKSKLAVIDRLKEAQKGPVHLLDQIASCIPQRVWLSKMTENGSSMTLEGVALEHKQIARFMQNLNKSPFFSNVELSSALTKSSAKGGVEEKTFHLSCNIRIPKDLL